MQPFRDDDDEDINLFLSAQQFSGRTPNAATVRSRIFQDAALEQARKEQEQAESKKQKNIAKRSGADKGAPRIERYTIHDEEMGIRGGTSKAPIGIAEQARIRSAISCANCVAATLGLVVAAAAAYVASGQRDVGAVALLFSAAPPPVRSPLYIGVALFVGGITMVLYGAGVGMGALAEGLSSGLVTQAHRVTFVLYLVLVFIALTACTMGMIVSGGALVAIQGPDSVTRGIWTAIPSEIICHYEQAHRCAGRIADTCMPVLGSTNALSDCPAIFCNHFCQTKNSSNVDCAPCRTLIARGSISRCLSHELKTNKVNGCSSGIIRRVRVLMVVALTASLTGFVTSLTVAIANLMVSSP